MDKQGTEWTEPGQGATRDQLILAIQDDPMHHAKPKDADSIVPYLDGWTSTRTNLRLTGEPLTAEDLERIAKCK